MTIEADKVIQSLSYYRNLELSRGASNVIDNWLSHYRKKLVEKISLEINTHQLLIETLDAYIEGFKLTHEKKHEK